MKGGEGVAKEKAGSRLLRNLNSVLQNKEATGGVPATEYHLLWRKWIGEKQIWELGDHLSGET